MIEEIKKETDNLSKEMEDILLSNFYREHTRATKYQSAWQELKNPNGLLYARLGPYEAKDRVIKLMQELEQKYNIVEEVSNE